MKSFLKFMASMPAHTKIISILAEILKVSVFSPVLDQKPFFVKVP